MTPVLYYLSYICLPDKFVFIGVEEGGVVTSGKAFVCTAMGLWGGLIIGYATEYFTSNAYAPV
jgi:inorganic pyrophosphatase